MQIPMKTGVRKLKQVTPKVNHVPVLTSHVMAFIREVLTQSFYRRFTVLHNSEGEQGKLTAPHQSPALLENYRFMGCKA